MPVIPNTLGWPQAGGSPEVVKFETSLAKNGETLYLPKYNSSEGVACSPRLSEAEAGECLCRTSGDEAAKRSQDQPTVPSPGNKARPGVSKKQKCFIIKISKFGEVGKVSLGTLVRSC